VVVEDPASGRVIVVVVVVVEVGVWGAAAVTLGDVVVVEDVVSDGMVVPDEVVMEGAVDD
jgi:hypothetical protein